MQNVNSTRQRSDTFIFWIKFDFPDFIQSQLLYNQCKQEL